MKYTEEPFEVVETSKDDSVENPEVNIFFEVLDFQTQKPDTFRSRKMNQNETAREQ